LAERPAQDGRDRARHGACADAAASGRGVRGARPVVVKRFRDNAARIADRLYAIDRGEIIFEGKPQQALEDENVMRALRG
jgi:hypothetical protein